MIEQFWWLLTMAAIGWYSTITIYVSIRGAMDVRNMLAALKNQELSDRAND
jgi:hypothetical protein